MTKIKHISLTAVLALFSIIAHAQNGVNSPYSRYGFGLLSDRSMGFNKGMAGVAQGFRDGQIINVANPASYSAVDTLTALIDLGLSVSNNNYRMNGLQQNVRNASFDYAAIHFRLIRNLGMAVGITPISNIKYSFSSSEVMDNDNTTQSSSYQGDGGLRQVFLGAGWQFCKPLSIGVNGSFIWGDYSHTMTRQFSESTISSLTRKYSAEIATYGVEVGLQYTQPITKLDRFTLGATYGLGHSINNNAKRYSQRGTITDSSVPDEVNSAFEWPHSVAAGITYYHANNLRIGFDFELQKWSEVKFPNNDTEAKESSAVYTTSKGQLYDRQRYALGAEYVPNPLGNNIFKRMSYKIGGYYSLNYAKADITNKVTDRPTEFGITAGVTIPLANRNLWNDSPKVNVSAQWVHTNIPYLSANTSSQQTLTENYLRLCVGVTISERWFHKWKVK